MKITIPLIIAILFISGCGNSNAVNMNYKELEKLAESIDVNGNDGTRKSLEVGGIFLDLDYLDENINIEIKYQGKHITTTAKQVWELIK